MLDSNKSRAGTGKLQNTKMHADAAPPGQASLPTANSTDSFWHSDPSKILLGHRTTASLPTEADVVIIGSGISGASAAHFLRQDDRGKDLKVVMLEAREACWGATGRVCLLLCSTTSELKLVRMEVIVPRERIPSHLIFENLSCKTSRLWKPWSPSMIFNVTGEASQ